MLRIFVFLAIWLSSSLAFAILPKPEEGMVVGDFVVAGYLSAGFGWQRMGDAPITEFTNDGSFAGVLGSVLPDVTTGQIPQPGQDTVMAFVEDVEVDIMRTFGARTKLRADMLFGRPLSGSWTPASGIELEQGYAVWELLPEHQLDLTIGHFATLAGFETPEPYFNDTISWSILARTNFYPYTLTGAQLSIALAPRMTLQVAAANGIVDDTSLRPNDAPSGMATFQTTWGEDPKQSWISLTSFVGPASGSNRHLSFGATLAMGYWATDRFQLGIDTVYHRDNGAGGPNTDYAAGLINLHLDVTDRSWGFLRYSFARQFNIGNGVLNLTGTEQNISEMSIGGGYDVAEGIRLKVEGRLDAVAPAGGATQWTPGAALGLACAF